MRLFPGVIFYLEQVIKHGSISVSKAQAKRALRLLKRAQKEEDESEPAMKCRAAVVTYDPMDVSQAHIDMGTDTPSS